MRGTSFNTRAGFSLVELALVLAILGLLVGGIMGGQAMIKNARVNKVLADAKLYATAKEQFRQQYGYLPGDFPTATSVWGDDAAACASAATADGTPGTCDGDGNTVLADASAADGTGEIFQLWKQLHLAGMITGNFTGLNGPDHSNHDIIFGTNSPVGSIENTGFWYYSWGYQVASTQYYEGDYTNTMVFGARYSPGGMATRAALKPGDAYAIDKKTDDGYPGLGNVRTYAPSWGTPNVGLCSSSDTASTATYELSSTTSGCVLFFLQSFQAPQSL